MLYVYIGCLAFGILYSAVSFLLGSHGFDHSGLDHGGGAGGHAASHDAEVPSPFNPLVISCAIIAFGAVGLIGNAGFGMGDLASAIVALGFAGVIGAAIFFGVVKFMYNSQSNSVFSMEDLIGTDAEVITPIPAHGMGEITYSINGVRYNQSAGSFTQEEIGRGAAVIIRSIAGNAAVVQKKMTLEELSLLEEESNPYKEREKENL